MNSRPHHYQWCALPLSYRSFQVPAATTKSPGTGRRAAHERLLPHGVASGKPLLRTSKAQFRAAAEPCYPYPMSKRLKTPSASQPPNPAARRAQRLEAALRENLKKRKDRARGRDAPKDQPDAEP